MNNINLEDLIKNKEKYTKECEYKIGNNKYIFSKTSAENSIFGHYVSYNDVYKSLDNFIKEKLNINYKLELKEKNKLLLFIFEKSSIGEVEEYLMEIKENLSEKSSLINNYVGSKNEEYCNLNNEYKKMKEKMNNIIKMTNNKLDREKYVTWTIGIIGTIIALVGMIIGLLEYIKQ